MKILLLLSILSLYSCSHHSTYNKGAHLAGIQMIDRNDFSESINSKEKLKSFESVDFTGPQPYKKVLRVFSKDGGAHTPSIITTYHNNGFIWQYLDVVDGRAKGDYKEWYPNGQLKIEAHPIEGIADLSAPALASWVFEGPCYIWDEKGNKTATILYSKGVLEGVSTYYYPTGEIEKTIPYAFGRINGTVQMFDKTSKIISEENFVNGIKEGKSFALWPEGGTAFSEEYEEDALISGIYYSKEGTILSEIVKGNGKKVLFNGSFMERLVEYKKGKPEGLVEIFSASKKKIGSFTIIDGKKEGLEWEYFEYSSKPKLSIHWREDRITEMKNWYANGKQESQSEFLENKKNGESFAWYEEGSLMLHEVYEKGKIVKGSYYKKGSSIPISKIHDGRGVATLYDKEGRLLHKVIYEKGEPLIEN